MSLMTDIQELLDPIKEKIKKLTDEISILEAKKTCPFYDEYGSKIVCPYKNDEWHTCFNIDIGPGNGDAWCTIMIQKGIDASDGLPDILDTLKELEKEEIDTPKWVEDGSEVFNMSSLNDGSGRIALSKE